MLDAAQDGMTEEDSRDAIEADGGDAGEWWSRATDREQDRTVQRAFATVEREQQELAAMLDDGAEDDPRIAVDALLFGNYDTPQERPDRRQIPIGPERRD